MIVENDFKEDDEFEGVDVVACEAQPVSTSIAIKLVYFIIIISV